MAECSVCSVLSKVARIQFFLLLKNGKEFFIKIYEKKKWLNVQFVSLSNLIV